MDYTTFHYGDNGINDAGWGCSYRNIQTIISCYKNYYNNDVIIPTIQEIIAIPTNTNHTIRAKEISLCSKILLSHSLTYCCLLGGHLGLYKASTSSFLISAYILSVSIPFSLVYFWHSFFFFSDSKH